MIREAEQNGNAYAALWHLDRVISARPNDTPTQDWNVTAREKTGRGYATA
jgi:hypothetical protein